MKSTLRNEIKSYIVRSGYTMQEVVEQLSEEHGWSDSVSNLSNKLQRESLRYVEVVQLADALGYSVPTNVKNPPADHRDSYSYTQESSSFCRRCF